MKKGTDLSKLRARLVLAMLQGSAVAPLVALCTRDADDAAALLLMKDFADTGRRYLPGALKDILRALAARHKRPAAQVLASILEVKDVKDVKDVNEINEINEAMRALAEEVCLAGDVLAPMSVGDARRLLTVPCVGLQDALLTLAAKPTDLRIPESDDQPNDQVFRLVDGSDGFTLVHALHIAQERRDERLMVQVAKAMKSSRVYDAIIHRLIVDDAPDQLRFFRRFLGEGNAVEADMPLCKAALWHLLLHEAIPSKEMLDAALELRVPLPVAKIVLEGRDELLGDLGVLHEVLGNTLHYVMDHYDATSVICWDVTQENWRDVVGRAVQWASEDTVASMMNLLQQQALRD